LYLGTVGEILNGTLYNVCVSTRRHCLLLALLCVICGAGTAIQPAIATERPIGTVYLFLSTHCPISNRYAPRLALLASRFGGRQIRFVGIYEDGDTTAASVTQHAREHGLTFPLLRDADGSRARRWGASVTPEAVVVDRTGAVRYRGRIDDNEDLSRVTSADLQRAIEALIAGKAVVRRETRAVGCAIQSVVAAKTPSTDCPTYAEDVAPILNANCVSCHRAGQIGPMPFGTYRQAAAWATQIKLVTQKRSMPPWKADSHGEFMGERRLTDAQIGVLAAWADGGAPEGDARHAPPPPTFAKSEWPLGEPDAVFEMPERYEVSADGKDVYRCFVIPSRYTEDRWVAGIAFAPGNRAVVHHATVFQDDSGAARRLDDADTGPGYKNPTPGNGPGYKTTLGALGGWTPGHEPRLLPAGVAERLQKGADLVLEVHYHPDGKPETDRTRFGLYFAKGPIDKRMRMGDVSSFDFHIPPGKSDFVVMKTATLPFDITVLSVTPHMHNLGRSMRVTATLPGSATPISIVSVPGWDFNWQPSYRYRTPLKLPRGTRIDLEAHFDNTAENPAQPNRPPREVLWGESTSDEMCTCFFAYTLDSEHLADEPVVVPAQ